MSTSRINKNNYKKTTSNENTLRQPAISIFVSQTVLIIADFDHVLVQNLFQTLEAQKQPNLAITDIPLIKVQKQ